MQDRYDVRDFVLGDELGLDCRLQTCRRMMTGVRSVWYGKGDRRHGHELAEIQGTREDAT